MCTYYNNYNCFCKLRDLVRGNKLVQWLWSFNNKTLMKTTIRLRNWFLTNNIMALRYFKCKKTHNLIEGFSLIIIIIISSVEIKSSKISSTYRLCQDYKIINILVLKVAHVWSYMMKIYWSDDKNRVCAYRCYKNKLIMHNS